MENLVIGLLSLLIVLGLYLLPALIAIGRRHHNWPAILILNLFLGWTFLGWIAALIWAATAVHRVRVEYLPAVPTHPNHSGR